MADYNRARTLAEGLGLLSKNGSGSPPPLDAHGPASGKTGRYGFIHWGKSNPICGPSPHKKHAVSTPVKNCHRCSNPAISRAMSGQQVVFETGQPGWNRALPHTGRAPPQALLPRMGSGHHSRRESKQPEFRGHSWSVSRNRTTGSKTRPSRTPVRLRLLGNTQSGGAEVERKLLLIGNSVAPNQRYPDLPKAALQVETVAQHFPASERVVLTREQATPDAYAHSKLEQFSHIHLLRTERPAG